MIDVTNTIVEILTVASKFSGEQTSENKDLDDVLLTVGVPHYQKAEINQISYEFSMKRVLKDVMKDHEFTFTYVPSLLDQISDLTTTKQTVIDYLSIPILYSWIAWILQYQSSHIYSSVIPLLKAMNFALDSENSIIIRQCFVHAVERYLESDTNADKRLIDIHPYILEFLTRVPNPNLVLITVHHFTNYKDFESDACFYQFLGSVANIIKKYDHFFEKSMFLQFFRPLYKFITNLEPHALDLLLVCTPPFFDEMANDIIPEFKNAMIKIIQSIDNISFPESTNVVNQFQFKEPPKCDFLFSSVQTLPDGFNPMQNVEFPTLIDISTLFSSTNRSHINKILNLLSHNPDHLEMFIDLMFSILASEQYQNLIVPTYITICYICSETIHNNANVFTISFETALLFYNPRIFDPSITVFNKGIDFSLISTLRSISLECILSDFGAAIEDLLIDLMNHSPLLIAETFERLAAISTIFAQQIEKYPQLINILTKAINVYRYFEMNNLGNVDDIRVARISLFRLFAHLFTIDRILFELFMNNNFLYAFVSCIFEESLKSFILSIIRTYLNKVPIDKITELPIIFLNVLKTINAKLPSPRPLALLNDLMIVMDDCFSYRRALLNVFKELCPILCPSMAKLDTDNLSKKIYEQTISFFALMSPYFSITALEIDALISALTSFNDREFVESLFCKFIQLLAGECLASTKPIFIVQQPQVIKMLVQVFAEDRQDIIDFVYQLCKYSPLNIYACANCDLQIVILEKLEKAKFTESLDFSVVKTLLNLLEIISISYSTPQSVLRYISLIAPIDENHVSKYQDLFINYMNDMTLESYKSPENCFPLNHGTLKRDLIANVEEYPNGFSFAFWLYIEANSPDKSFIFNLDFQNMCSVGLFVSNECFFLVQDDTITESTAKIYEGIETQIWHFFTITYSVNPHRSIVTLSCNLTVYDNIILPLFESELNFSKFTLTIGSKNTVKSDSNSLPSKLGWVGMFPALNEDKVMTLYELGIRPSMRPPNSLFFLCKYKNTEIKTGFVDVMISQCGLDTILPVLTLKNYFFKDETNFVFTLDSAIMMITNFLLYSQEAQIKFYHEKGFNIFTHLVEKYWLDQYNLKIYYKLYSLIQSIRHEPLQQQLFTSFLTNFHILLTIDPDVHSRILQHWSGFLFPTCKQIALNFCGFEDILSIMRIYYWYSPVETIIAAFKKDRPAINVEMCRNYLFQILYMYLTDDGFTENHFNYILSHIISCAEVLQVKSLIQFLTIILKEKSIIKKINFKKTSIVFLLQFVLMKCNDPEIPSLVFSLLSAAHTNGFVSDPFMSTIVQTLILIIPSSYITKELLNMVKGMIDENPQFFIMCSYFLSYFPDEVEHFFTEIKPNEAFAETELWVLWPLSIYSQISSLQLKDVILQFLIDCSIESLLPFIAQIDIIFWNYPEQKVTLLHRVMNLLKSMFFSQVRSNLLDFYEVCQRIIFFQPINQLRALDYLYYLNFPEEKDKKSEEKLFNANDFMSTPLPKIGFDFGLVFDKNQSWDHLNLAITILEIFTQSYNRNFLPLDLTLCAYVQVSGFDGTQEHLDILKLTDQEKEMYEYPLELIKYHASLIENTEDQIVPPTVNYSKHINSLTPFRYFKVLDTLRKFLRNSMKKISEQVKTLANFDINKHATISGLSISQIIERNQIMNENCQTVWNRLWTAISIQRAPWFCPNHTTDNWKRDDAPCFGLVPMLMVNSITSYESALEYKKTAKRDKLFLFRCNIIFIDKTIKAKLEIHKSYLCILFPDGKVITIMCSSITNVLQRANNKMQIFTSDGYTLLISFDEAETKSVMKEIEIVLPQHDQIIVQIQSHCEFFSALPFTNLWVAGKMSNYQYILALNHMSGKSFLDIDNYPIFPWILSDFSTETLDHNNHRIFRDLGALRSRNLMDQDSLIAFLSRIEPFRSLSNEQKYFSMEDYMQMGNKTELVPEFFTMPEIVDDANFALPLWANSPIDFVYKHRKMLESPLVSATLNEWFNIIWGPQSTNHLFLTPHPQKSFENRSPFLKEFIEHPVNMSADYCSFIEESDNRFTLILVSSKGLLSKLTIDPNLSNRVKDTVVKASSFDLPKITKRQRNRPSSPFIRPSSLSTSAVVNMKIEQFPKHSQIQVLSPTKFAILQNDKSTVTIIDSSFKHEVVLESGHDKVKCCACDGPLFITGGENATLSLFKDLKPISLIQLYRDSVNACAASATFNVAVGGTKDGCLIVCSTVTCGIIRVIDLGKMIPMKIVVSPCWGFIVTYVQEISAGFMKHFILVHTINGVFVNKREIDSKIDKWFCWESSQSFDYMIYSTESGKLYYFEIYDLVIKPCLFSAQSQVLSLQFFANSFTIAVLTADGKAYFIPLCIK